MKIMKRGREIISSSTFSLIACEIENHEMMKLIKFESKEGCDDMMRDDKTRRRADLRAV